LNKISVAVWGTGNVGTEALRAIIDSPSYELAGVIVHSETKNGIDAGEICGRPATGVLATASADRVLGARPDVVCYTATAERRGRAAVAEHIDILSRGIDVVSTAIGTLVYPAAAPEKIAAPIRQACSDGESTCYTAGLDPGFANDVLPLTLAGCTRRVESVRTMEIIDYSTYRQPQFLFDILGFGKPLDSVPAMLRPGVLTRIWGPVIEAMAAGLGVQVERFTEEHERVPAAEGFGLATGLGRIEAGTAEALRFQLAGVVAGYERLFVEHVTRVRRDAVPDWPRLPGRGGYRIIVTGEPSVTCDLTCAPEPRDREWLLVTAMRAVNAIPAVVAAAPGLVSVFDLPPLLGRGLMR
jgi:hypothetical protein